jgi:hypothetical protein
LIYSNMFANMYISFATHGCQEQIHAASVLYGRALSRTVRCAYKNECDANACAMRCWLCECVRDAMQ